MNHEATDTVAMQLGWIQKPVGSTRCWQNVVELRYKHVVARRKSFPGDLVLPTPILLFAWSLTLSPIHNAGYEKPATNFLGRRRRAQLLVPDLL
jgi:hypothetical protein